MIFFESSSSSDEEYIIKNKIERRRFRDRSNIFELPIKEFSQYFRVNKEAFRMILECLQLKSNMRATGIQPTLQLAVTLNTLASGSYQLNVGSNKIISMAQTSISKAFRSTLKVMEKELCPRWISRKEHSFNATQEYFFNKYKIPGVVGIVDSTHIPILQPQADEHAFFNRKGFHSLNVMIVCNHLYEILAIDASNGGASHDSAVWNKNNLNEYLKQKYEECSLRILGDSGYPLLPWLLTPYRAAADESSEMRFNYILAKARSQVERTIGILKARWRCLSSERKLRYTPAQVANIVNVCAALHNICVSYKIEVHGNFEDIVHNERITEESFSTAIIERNVQRRAQLIRDNIKNNIL